MGNVIALINWPEPNNHEPYDVEFVRRVRPRALFVIWEFRDDNVKVEAADRQVRSQAGSQALHNYLRFPGEKIEYVLMADAFEIGQGYDFAPEYGKPQYHMQIWKRYDVEVGIAKCNDADVAPVQRKQDLDASRWNEKLLVDDSPTIQLRHCQELQECRQCITDAGKRHQTEMENYLCDVMRQNAPPDYTWIDGHYVWSSMIRGENNMQERSRVDGDELRADGFRLVALENYHLDRRSLRLVEHDSWRKQHSRAVLGRWR